MKQHITVEQLLELSENARNKLDKWWRRDYIKNGCGKWSYLSKRDNPTIQKNIEPLLTIGQMIGFLDEKNIFIDHFMKQYGMDKKVDQYWEIGYLWFDKEKRLLMKHELCDALWEAVKEVLK